MLDWNNNEFESIKLARSENAISTEQQNETVILDLTSGAYSGLNSVGNDIWKLLEEPKSFTEICNALLAEYDVEPAQCQNSVKSFLQTLEKEGLIVAVL